MTKPSLHPLAAAFDGAADAYERGRPGYPADAMAIIRDRMRLAAGRVVLDLAAGTGKMTRELLASGARVVAVEPVAGMRAHLASTAPGAEALDGTAEAIPLRNASVDGAVVAQAFHWFDTAPALSELHRVIRGDGWLVLAYNVRDESVPWVRAMGDLIERTTGQELPSQHRGWQDRLARSALFEPPQTVETGHAHRLTVDGVVDRVASISTVAALGRVARDRLVADLRRLLADDPATAGRDEVDLPYITRLHLLRRRSIDPGDAGIVVSVNRNEGGVPKRPVDAARVLRQGLEGDRHREPEPIHGGPDQAICLYAQEAIERVRADGHRAFPGAFGENLTLLGIDWGSLRPGDRLRFDDAAAEDDGVDGGAGIDRHGDLDEGEAAGNAAAAGGLDGTGGAILELTKYAAPCQTLADAFMERRIGRISGRTHPDDARWYARVVREGEVRPGLAVRAVRGGG